MADFRGSHQATYTALLPSYRGEQSTTPAIDRRKASGNLMGLRRPRGGISKFGNSWRSPPEAVRRRARF